MNLIQTAGNKQRGVTTKSGILKGIFTIILIFSILTVSPQKVDAASETTIRAVNILGQGVVALLKGIIQGKVKNLKSAGKMLFWGSVAGYGFYESKKMIGKGQVTTGAKLLIIDGDFPFY